MQFLLTKEENTL